MGGDGTIDFREFMVATDMTASGSAEEKLHWAFKIYDQDGSGTIELCEMIDIIGALYEMDGISKDSAKERAEQIFLALDFNQDGELCENEFVTGCLQDEELVRVLNNGQADVSGKEERRSNNKE